MKVVDKCETFNVYIRKHLAGLVTQMILATWRILQWRMHNGHSFEVLAFLL